MLLFFKATKTRKLACSVFFTALALATHNTGAQTPGAPPTAMAQAPSAPVLPKRNVDVEVLQMTKRYDLSTSQAAQIHSILEDETKKTEAMLGDASLTPM